MLFNMSIATQKQTLHRRYITSNLCFTFSAFNAYMEATYSLQFKCFYEKSGAKRSVLSVIYHDNHILPLPEQW